MALNNLRPIKIKSKQQSEKSSEEKIYKLPAEELMEEATQRYKEEESKQQMKEALLCRMQQEDNIYKLSVQKPMEEMPEEQQKEKKQRQQFIEARQKRENEEQKGIEEGSRTIKEVLDKLLQSHLELAIYKKHGESDIDEEVRFSIVCNVVRAFKKQLDDYTKDFIEKYKKQLKKKDNHYPLKWMLDDPIISKLLGKFRICDVLNAFDKYLVNHKEDKVIVEEKYKKAEKEYNYAAFITNDLFYNDILGGLKMSKNTLQQYIKAFRDIGVLKMLFKTGKYENIPVYALGYYSLYRGNPKLEHFLTLEMKSKMRQFTIFQTATK